MDWISVNDRLPDFLAPVLVVHTENAKGESPVWIAWRVGSDPTEWAWSSIGIDFFPEVLYWMPLPEPPTEVEDGKEG